MPTVNDRKIAPNVWDFLDKASADYGQIHEGRFSQEMHCQMLEHLESPIEDLFFIACHVLCEAESIAVNPDPIFKYLENGKLDLQNIEPGQGVAIRPQAKIGPYRVDFLIEQHDIVPNDSCLPIVVELDGHNFHDKDKRQRSYEKARDRFLVKEKYRVLHFTGSDVVSDPYRVAFEALEFVGVFIGSCDKYDPQNPFGFV